MPGRDSATRCSGCFNRSEPPTNDLRKDGPLALVDLTFKDGLLSKKVDFKEKQLKDSIFPPAQPTGKPQDSNLPTLGEKDIEGSVSYANLSAVLEGSGVNQQSCISEYVDTIQYILIKLFKH